MKIILSLILTFIMFNAFSQSVNNQEKILYVVDGIPIIEDPDASSGTLTNNDIDHLRVVTDSLQIKAYGYTAIDKMIFISTKEFIKRPDSIKKIPTTKLMERKDGVWYLKNSPTPYTGTFIDYFLNGHMQGNGTLKNGIINGLRTVYYENGNVKYFTNYKDGIENGVSEDYFINGKIEQKGNYKDGKDDGLWIAYYSTGAIKRQTNFINTVPDMTNDEKKFFELRSKAQELIKAEDYKGAIKKLDEAEKLNSNYADLYFDRGTAKLNNFDFDNAVLDFDKAIALEPLYMEAYGNRAFARIRKYEFRGSRTLESNSEVTIMATKNKVEIPVDEKAKICSDLNKSVELGNTKQMILDAIKDYCTP